MEKKFNELLNTQVRIRKCFEEIKEQQGARFFKKIEEEFQVQIKDWMPKYKAHVSFAELLNYANDEKLSLEIKEQIYLALEGYL
jgi:transcriptional regulator of aromatic amino acid metabolism